jgi:hypothetical protein
MKKCLSSLFSAAILCANAAKAFAPASPFTVNRVVDGEKVDTPLLVLCMLYERLSLAENSQLSVVFAFPIDNVVASSPASLPFC